MEFKGTEQEIMNLFAVRERAQLEAYKILQQKLGQIPTATEQALAEMHYLPQYRAPIYQLPPAAATPYQTPYYQHPYAETAYYQPAPPPQHTAQSPQVTQPPTVVQPHTVIQSPVEPVVDVHSQAISAALAAIEQPKRPPRSQRLEQLKKHWLSVASVAVVVGGLTIAVTGPDSSFKEHLASLKVGSSPAQVERKVQTPAPTTTPTPSPASTPAPVEEATPPVAPPPPAEAPAANPSASAEAVESMVVRLEGLFPSVQ